MAASAEETTLPETSEQMEESDPSKDTDGFIQVTKKKGRKRKVEEEKMDVVSGKESKKRPQFPPLQGNKLLVRIVYVSVSLADCATNRT